MSTIEEGLITYLTGIAGLSALVGGRIYSMHNVQDLTLPSITYQRVSTERTLTHDQTWEGLAHPRFQFNVYAKTYSQALDIGLELRKALQGYSGTFGTIPVYAVLPLLEQHTEDRDLDLYNLIIDYKVSHKE